MKVTIFKSRNTNKVPVSPFGDNSFEFFTSEVESIRDVFYLMTNEFVMNIPLTKKRLRSRKRLQDLTEYISDTIEYIMIDIDGLTLSDREIAIQWFKEQPYNIILGASRTDYNIKGVLRVEPMSINQGKEVLKQLRNNLPGTVDQTALYRVHHQAPIGKYEILLDQPGIGYPIPKITTKKEIVPEQVTDEITKLCIGEFINKGYRFENKTQDGYICSHWSEKKTPRGFRWRSSAPFDMTHWNPARYDNVWDEVRILPEYKKFQKQKSKQKVLDLLDFKETFTCNDRYLTRHPKEVQNFLDNYDILRIHSPMGTAKTSIIEEVLFQSQKKGLRVLFLANRISLVNDIVSKYEDIKHYTGTEIEGNEYNIGDNLAVQIDSLHKYSTKYFDIVVMDEYTTTLMKLLSIEKNKNTTLKKFWSLHKKKLVLSDAFLLPALDLFPGKTLEINNEYRDEVDFEIYGQKDIFIDTLIKTAKDQPCSFSCGSISMMKIVEILGNEHGLNVVSIQSETPKEIKHMIYESFKKEKPIADILMYSPTLTVGVSNENNIYEHFHYDTGQSMDCYSSLQMIKRTRKAARIHVYLEERIRYYPTNLDVIRNKLTEFHETDDDGDYKGMSPAGEILTKITQIYNILENRHKVSFLGLLKQQFRPRIHQIKDKVKPFISKYQKKVKEENVDKILEMFEKYKTMTPNLISEIIERPYGTKFEDQVKEFEKYRSDPDLELFPSDITDELIEENIQTPGMIDKVKELINKEKLLELPDMMVPRNYNNDYKILYTRKRKNRWYLKPLVKKIKDIYENNSNRG